MIDYEPDLCGCNLVFRLHGSAYLRGCMWGVPSALFTLMIHSYVRTNKESLDGIDGVWRIYSGVLSFLAVFRTTQAYDRFWDASKYIQKARGEWVAAVSNLFAYCSREPAKQTQVRELKASVVGLVSMLFAQNLQLICTSVSAEIALDVIGGSEVDQTYIDFLASTESPTIVVLGWIEHVVMDANEAGLIRAAPPLLSRAFAMFSSGLISLKHAGRLNEVPIPFPYDQVIQLMMVIQTLVFPVVSSIWISSPAWAAAMCLMVVCTFWQLVYIAREIDHPFGDDANDLDIAVLQKDLNESLLTLMLPMAQDPPKYKGLLSRNKAFLRHDHRPVNRFTFYTPQASQQFQRRSPSRGFMGSRDAEPVVRPTWLQRLLPQFSKRGRRGSSTPSSSPSTEMSPIVSATPRASRLSGSSAQMMASVASIMPQRPPG